MNSGANAWSSAGWHMRLPLLVLWGAILLSPTDAPAQQLQPLPPANPAAPPAIAPAGGAPAELMQKPSARPPKKTFLQIFFSGGPVGIANMLVLIGLSLTAVYLVFDNILRIRRKDLVPEEISRELRKLVEQGRLAEATQLCKANPCFLTAIVQQALTEADGDWPEIEKAMEDATAEQAAKLFRWIEYLSVIGNLAPMVGLLGTVTGMLLAFKEVAETEGKAGAAALADGIYQALVTTVYGLVIAIPALGFFAMFRSWIDELIAEAAYAGLHILAPLKQRQRGTQAPPIAPAPPAPPAPPRAAGGR
ncbi:Biopolymer transport protein ExbB [Anatilimnocola aggregata]|uniref:Biopolymer transport protein ExbB n=1 Tax=Anatilimnocola aggregata TaxID=2528021 RepID=A0A517YKU7_9BACT|nr:Biopolymer transport protein ExbB [Anatilimnocola aggregata]